MQLGGAKMRAPAWIIFATAMISGVAPAWAQGRYDPAYPVCMEVYGADGSRIECFYTSMPQCKEAQSGMAGSCFNNPIYVAPPPEPAPVADPVPAPAAKSKKPKH